MKTPLGIPSIEEQDLIAARLFHQLEISGAVLRQLLLKELRPNREIRRRLCPSANWITGQKNGAQTYT